MSDVLGSLWAVQCLDEQVSAASRTLDTARKASTPDGDLIQKLQRRCKALQRKRDRQIDSLDPSTRGVYARLSRTGKVDIMAPIEKDEEQKAPTYFCGGCFMSIPAEEVNVLRQRSTLRTCNTCGRVLFLPERLDGGKTPIKVRSPG